MEAIDKDRDNDQADDRNFRSEAHQPFLENQPVAGVLQEVPDQKKTLILIRAG